MKGLDKGRPLNGRYSVLCHEGLTAGSGLTMERTVRSASGKQWKVSETG